MGWRCGGPLGQPLRPGPARRRRRRRGVAVDRSPLGRAVIGRRRTGPAQERVPWTSRRCPLAAGPRRRRGPLRVGGAGQRLIRLGRVGLFGGPAGWRARRPWPRRAGRGAPVGRRGTLRVRLGLALGGLLRRASGVGRRTAFDRLDGPRGRRVRSRGACRPACRRRSRGEPAAVGFSPDRAATRAWSGESAGRAVGLVSRLGGGVARWGRPVCWWLGCPVTQRLRPGRRVRGLVGRLGGGVTRRRGRVRRSPRKAITRRRLRRVGRRGLVSRLGSGVTRRSRAVRWSPRETITRRLGPRRRRRRIRRLRGGIARVEPDCRAWQGDHATARASAAPVGVQGGCHAAEQGCPLDAWRDDHAPARALAAPPPAWRWYRAVGPGCPDAWQAGHATAPAASPPACQPAWRWCHEAARAGRSAAWLPGHATARAWAVRGGRGESAGVLGLAGASGSATRALGSGFSGDAGRSGASCLPSRCSRIEMGSNHVRFRLRTIVSGSATCGAGGVYASKSERPLESSALGSGGLLASGLVAGVGWVCLAAASGLGVWLCFWSCGRLGGGWGCWLRWSRRPRIGRLLGCQAGGGVGSAFDGSGRRSAGGAGGLAGWESAGFAGDSGDFAAGAVGAAVGGFATGLSGGAVGLSSGAGDSARGAGDSARGAGDCLLGGAAGGVAAAGFGGSGRRSAAGAAGSAYPPGFRRARGRLSARRRRLPPRRCGRRRRSGFGGSGRRSAAGAAGSGLSTRAPAEFAADSARGAGDCLSGGAAGGVAGAGFGGSGRRSAIGAASSGLSTRASAELAAGLSVRRPRATARPAVRRAALGRCSSGLRPAPRLGATATARCGRFGLGRIRPRRLGLGRVSRP